MRPANAIGVMEAIGEWPDPAALQREPVASGVPSPASPRAAKGAARRRLGSQAPADGDGRLLVGLRAGEMWAVEELVDRYHARIFGLARSILRNESDAEEAAQDVFMIVVRKANAFQGNAALYSWMYRICVNACLMRLRGKRGRDTVSIEEFMPLFTDEGTHRSPMDDWSREVEREALNDELGRMIRRYTGELSDRYRAVFELADVEGLSNEETAKILGITVAAVKSRLHRARLYLRERLTRYLRDDPAA